MASLWCPPRAASESLSCSSSSLNALCRHCRQERSLFPRGGEHAPGLDGADPLNLSLKEKVCGLCGNFDGIQNNDLTSSNLQVEEDPVDFGNSWKVSSQCADTRKVRLGLLCGQSPRACFLECPPVPILMGAGRGLWAV